MSINKVALLILIFVIDSLKSIIPAFSLEYITYNSIKIYKCLHREQKMLVLL